MKMCWFATITLSLVCLAGCQTAKNETAENAGEITSESLNRIVDRQWILQHMAVDGNKYDLAGERPFIEFSSDGKVSGFASVNRFSGSIQWDDQDMIQWSPLLSTRMAGPTELMDQESTFLKTLASVQRLSLEGIHLMAHSEDEQVELVFYVQVK